MTSPPTDQPAAPHHAAPHHAAPDLAATATSAATDSAPTDRPRRRPALLRAPVLPIVLSLLATAALAGGVAWSVTGKTASLAIDGYARPVDFRGGTVSDVLAAAGVQVGEHDVLVPSASTKVRDGGRVALRRGRELTLVVDGQPRTIWVTAASVDEALDQVGLRESGLELSASRSRGIPVEGFTLRVSTPKRVTLTLDGTTRTLTTSAPTVRDALVEAGVVLDRDDRLSASRTQRLREGQAIRAVRVTVQRVRERVAVPFRTERRADASLSKGSTKVVTTGRAGAVVNTVERVLADGALEKTTVLSTDRVSEPVTQVVAVGTKAPVPRAAARSSSGGSTAGADGLNFAALARCESGGNPRAVSSSGSYRGLYQFSIGTWRGVGGAGDPIDASPGEQTYRAKLLYQRSGRSPWPVCGRYL